MIKQLGEIYKYRLQWNKEKRDCPYINTKLDRWLIKFGYLSINASMENRANKEFVILMQYQFLV